MEILSVEAINSASVSCKVHKNFRKIPLQRGRGGGGGSAEGHVRRAGGVRGDLPRDGLHVARLQW